MQEESGQWTEKLLDAVCFLFLGISLRLISSCDQMWQYHCSDRWELHYVSIHFPVLFFVERTFRTAGFAAFLLLGFTLWQSFLSPKLSLTEGSLSNCVKHLCSFILMFQVKGTSKGCVRKMVSSLDTPGFRYTVTPRVCASRQFVFAVWVAYVGQF